MSKHILGSAITVTALALVLGACGSGTIAAGDKCGTKGEQTCSGNKEMSCDDDLRWKVDEDCGSKTCIVKSGGDADCE